MAKKKKLALDSDDETGSDVPPSNSAPRNKKRKTQNTSRREDVSTEDDEAELALIENSQAGLKTKTNGKGKDKEENKAKDKVNGKDKGKGKEKEKEKGKGWARELAIDERSEEETLTGEAEEEEDPGTQSEGTLYDSDAEPGLGKWNTKDQRHWQYKDEKDGDFPVEIIIRWRWHPKFHYAQYRVKWEGYEDYENLWEPIDSFDGDEGAEDFWKDYEFEGILKRPSKWNISREETLARLKREGKDVDDPEDTDSRLKSQSPTVRKEARKKSRRQIRIDRVEMKEAYRRRNLRDEAEKKMEMEKREKLAEERRRKKRQAEEEVKRNAAGPSRKVIITHGTKINLQGGNKLPAAVSTSTKTQPTATSSSTTKPEVNDNQRALAALFLPESDAKIKADRKKVKSIEDSKHSSAPNDDVLKPTSTTTAPVAKEGSSTTGAGALTTALTTSPRSGTSTAVRGGSRPAGSFRGQHKVPGRIKVLSAFDPLQYLQPSNGAHASSKPPPTSNINANTLQSPSILPTNGWDDDAVVSSSDPIASAPVHPAQQTNSNEVASYGGQSSFMRPPPPPPLAQRKVVRIGNDPRSRPSAMPSSSGSVIGFPASPMSPFGPMGNTSPLHPNMSPMRSDQSPQEGQDGAMSPVLDQKEEFTPAIRERARRAIDQKWKMDNDLQKSIAQSYNLLCPHHEVADRETRILFDSVVNTLRGGVIKTFEAKHKEKNRRVNAWVFNARIRLNPAEIEALKIPTIRFYEYESSIRKIWPSDSGRVVMYTLGALMIKLVEQIFEKEEVNAWTLEEGTSILIHPWQKEVLHQMIELDLVEDYLKIVAGMANDPDLPNKGFAILDSGVKVLEEMEELPSEFTLSNIDPPSVTKETVLRTMTKLVDDEICATLHRLQYEWRYEKRMFTLVMAKTRLEARDVPTAWVNL